MKKLLTIALALITWAGALAVPARLHEQTVKQGDGTTITIKKIGDEWYNATVTIDGLRVARGTDKCFHYVDGAGKLTAIVAHNPEMRSASEIAFINSNKPALDNTKKKAVKLAKRKARLCDTKRRATQVPNQASPRVPIVLVQFSDIKFSKSDTEIKAFYNTQMNAQGDGVVSCYQYFVDQSEGKYTPQFDVLGPVTVGARANYGAYDEETGMEDKALDEFVKDAVAKLPNVDWSLYDNNNDGEVDVVVFQYAGVGEASSYEEESIWPCQWDLVSAGYRYQWNSSTGDWDVVKEGEALTLSSGLVIDKFAVFNEMNGLYDEMPGDIDGVGTFCHEFSHCLGLPDFYATDYSNHFGMGSWSCLDYGCNNNEGYTPCGYTAYEKWFMGWKNLEDAVAGTTYSLDATVLKTGKGIKVPTDDANEYYILENRQLTSWDKYLPNHGLQVTHVYYDADAWENNEVNNYDTRRMTIIPADNSLKMDEDYDEYYNEYTYYTNLKDQVGDLFPYKGVDELTDESTPVAEIYTGNGKMGKPITNIVDANGIVTFNFMKEAVASPVLNDAENVTSTGFTASWSEVEDAQSYTLRLEYQDPNTAKPLIVEQIAELTGKTGYDYGKELNGQFANAGWTGEKVYLESGARLATGKVDGTLTSPSLNLQKGKVTVVFSAHTYGSDTNVNLKVATGSKSTSVAIGENDAEYVVVLDAATTDKVTFTATAKKRAIITAISIYDGDVREQLDGNNDDNITIIEGITATTYNVTGLQAGGTYVFDVKAVLADNESKYSNSKTVTLLSFNPFDINRDGYVNTGDISDLYDAIINGKTDISIYDVNNDKAINTGDVSSLYENILNNNN